MKLIFIYFSPLSVIEQSLNTNPIQSIDCLVDVWTFTRYPAVLVDISAGPFTWGPIVGDGVKSSTNFDITQFTTLDEVTDDAELWILSQLEARLESEKSALSLLCENGEKRRSPDHFRADSGLGSKTHELLTLDVGSIPIGCTGDKASLYSAVQSLLQAVQLRHKQKKAVSDFKSSLFVSQMGALLTSLVHHLFNPPSSSSFSLATKTRKVLPNSTRFYFPQIVVIHLYVAVDHHKYIPLGDKGVDVLLLEDQLKNLLQDIGISCHLQVWGEFSV